MSETDKTETDAAKSADKTVYPGDKIFGWTSHSRAGLITFILVAMLCVFLIAADFFVHRHEYFHLAETHLFYAVYGFIAFGGVVLSGWPLRKLLGRPENYYDPEETQND